MCIVTALQNYARGWSQMPKSSVLVAKYAKQDGKHIWIIPGTIFQCSKRLFWCLVPRPPFEALGSHFGGLGSSFWRPWASIWRPWGLILEALGVILEAVGVIFEAWGPMWAMLAFQGDFDRFSVRKSSPKWSRNSDA